MSSKNKTSRTTTRNIRFPNYLLGQIHMALEEKGSGNFSAWVIEACRRRLAAEKRARSAHVHAVKSGTGLSR
ncbi:YlcI/YnfO family protein [Escherichia coli]|nr:YlcI/YnfO family protein [Escherichia coli]